MEKMTLFRTVYLPENQGHGKARQAAIEACSYDLVALMDADDISLPDRFEKQLGKFESDKTLDIVGGQITEFIGDAGNIISRRIVPETDEQIKAYLKKRCPMNQVSVMFRRSSCEQAGGYLDWYCNEDYYLWIRMVLQGQKFANVPDTLVNVRVGNEMSARRGGWKYFSSEERLQRYMLGRGLISLPRYLYNVLLRFGGEVLVPASVRVSLYKLLRQKPEVLLHQETAFLKEKVSTRQDPPFSVAMCVYEKDAPQWLDTAIRSVLDQTVRPSEIVLVVDGPVPGRIQNVIDRYAGLCERG